MVSRDIEQTLTFEQMAEEAAVGLRLRRDQRLAGLPPKTLLLEFVNVVGGMDVDDVICQFPLITETIVEQHNNNPLAFDWHTLALAVDNYHGHFVCDIGKALNTK